MITTDFMIVKQRINYCILDKIQRNIDVENNLYAIRNLNNAIIILSYKTNKDRRIISFNNTYLKNKVIHKIYNILILFNNDKVGIIRYIPNIELTFRDHEIEYRNINLKHEFANYQKYHGKVCKVKSVEKMISIISKKDDNEINQIQKSLNKINLKDS